MFSVYPPRSPAATKHHAFIQRPGVMTPQSQWRAPGEGGVYVLYRLVAPHLRTAGAKSAVIFVSMLGVALLVADGIFTPAVRCAED